MQEYAEKTTSAKRNLFDILKLSLCNTYCLRMPNADASVKKIMCINCALDKMKYENRSSIKLGDLFAENNNLAQVRFVKRG